jgi:hypothetical protein
VFSRAEQDIVIDSIPLSEIKSIERLKETLNNTNHQANEDDSANVQFQSLLTRKKSMVAHPVNVESHKPENNSETTLESDPQASIANTRLSRPDAFGRNFKMSTRTLNLNVIQIKTDRDGHNSGRTYYLRMEKSEDCSQVLTTLSMLAKSAKIRAENKSRFERNQFQVRIVYNSRLFQYLMATLIFGVVMN